jgi:DNA-binding MarR family transcriptional regulator
MSIFDPLYRQQHISGQIARFLFGIGQAIKHMLWEKSKLEHLTPAQIQVLLYLNFVRSDAATVNSLARYLACTPATVSGILDVLENKKLIQRKKKAEDRRKVILNLTPKGSRVVSVVQDVGKEIEELVAEFTYEEQQILERLLFKISKKLIERGLIVSSDICANCCFFQKGKYPESKRPHYCELLNIFLAEGDIYKECPDYKAQYN